MIDYYQFLRQRTKDYREYLKSFSFDFKMDVNYTVPVSSPVMSEKDSVLRSDLKHWNRNLLQCLFGKHYRAKNDGDLFFFVAFFQKGPFLGKEHLHILVKVPAALHERFISNAARKWKATKDIVVKPAYDPDGAVNYCSDDLSINPDWIVFSSEFRRDLKTA